MNQNYNPKINNIAEEAEEPPPPTIDWTLWVQWLLATTVGWAIGWTMIGPAGTGVALGLAQWLVLRPRVQQAGWWIWAATVGWIVGWSFIVAGVLPPPDNDLAGSALLGLTLGSMLGISGWFVLRRWVRLASLWIPASIIGWTVAMTGIFGGTVAGAVAGAVTGLAIEWLLRHPRSEA